ncbi:hypothetical protein PLICRDRAFT_34394 [Plicaturopsis crispa FD-325 SS-3]|nr:hypothetical protein PLICRDRAFT_34394 [Plicaturopsis crispa FD-325 SS-3]
MTGPSGYTELAADSPGVHDTERTQASDPLLPNSDSGGFVRKTAYNGSLIIHEDGHGYSYSYGPKGLSGLLHNYYALGCAIFASIGGLTFGYDQGVIANVLVMKDFTARWPIGAWEKGLMTAVLELGALFGALAAGTLADRYSRRHSIFLACVIFCIGSGFQCGARTLSDLVLGRAIGGVGVGALSMLSPLYMAEISPPEVRGSLMALEQFSIVLGVVCGFWTGFLTRSIESSASWRIPLGAQIFPGVLLAVGCFFLPPSPRLSVLHGKNEEALASLATLRRRTPEEALSDPLLQIELLEMRVETTLINRTVSAEGKYSLRSEALAWARLFDRRYIDRTLIGIVMMFFQQWSGINALLYYGPTLVKSIGMRSDTASLMVSGGIGVVQFLAVFPAIMYIDRLGRKPLLRGGSAVMAMSHMTIALLIRQCEADWSAHTTAAWIAVGGVYVFTAAYGMSYGVIGWVLPSEVFPLSMRSKGVAVSTASNWINNFLIGLITPAIMELSASATFMVFACACAAGYFWSTYIVPETGSVSLELIDAMFASSAGQEDAQLKVQIERDLGLRDLIKELTSEEE